MLEENYEREKADNKEEIRRRNDAIRGLKKELDDANELIKTFKQKGRERDTFTNHFYVDFSPLIFNTRTLKHLMSQVQMFQIRRV